MNLTKTTAKRTLLASLALTLSAGLGACSSDSSNTTGSSKSGDAQNSTSAQPQAQTQSAPAWLVDGKVDIRKVDPSDVQAPCDKLLGSAKEAAQVVKVDANNEKIDLSDNFMWEPGTLYEGSDEKGTWYRLQCRPALTDQRDAYDKPSISISMREDPSKGTIEGDEGIQYDPIFGHGATKYVVVGKATIYSDFDFRDTAKPTSTNQFLNKSSDMQRPVEGKYTLPDDSTKELTKQQYIDKLKKNNAEIAAITAPLVDRAAQHVYGG